MLAARNTSRARQQELSAAYAALAVELTKHEIRSIGGYSLGRVIGEGTFGKVRLGVHRLTGTRVAIKQVPKSLPSYSPSDPSSPLSLLTREIHHHRRLRHPHVLSLYELVATESSIYLVTELCSGGELFDYLVEQCAAPAGTGGLALAETRRIFGQLVLGVAYLHSEGVVHRDLKLENVLLDENVNVKIADMGFGREFERGRWLETKVGTLGYTAPEIVAGTRYLGEQVDIWSLGVILYALLTGSLPFDDDDESVMRSLILSGRYAVPAFLDSDASDLVQRILVVDPLRRPSLRDVLAHPFFTRAPGPSTTTSSTRAAQGPAPPIASPAASLGAPMTPLASSSSAASGAPTHSYFAPSSSPPSSTASPDAPASAVSLGKRRAVDLDLTLPLGPGAASSAHSPSPSPSPAHPSSSSTSALPASALPPHLLPSSSSHALGAPSNSHPHPWSPSPLRRHPSTASIDFGPSAPPVVRTHSTGGTSVSSLQLGGAGVGAGAGPGGLGAGGGEGPSGAGAARKRRKSVGAASVRSVRSAMLGGAVSEEDEQEDGIEPPSAAAPASAPGAAPDDNSPRIDYLSLLLALTSPSSSSPSGAKDSPLTSPSDVALLAQLAAVGFDTGQVAHSVRTSACDSCAAAWWMLKRKKEELALRQSEEAQEQDGEVRAPSRTSSLRSLPTEEKRRSALLSQTEEDEEADEGDERSGAESDDDVFLTTAAVAAAPRLVASPLVLPETIPEEQRRPSVTSATSAFPSSTLAVPLTPPRRPSITSHASPRTPSSPAPTTLPPLSPALVNPSPAVAAARLSYFLQADPATPLPPVESEPLLSYFPVADGAPGSPSRPRIGAGAAASLGSSTGRSRSRSGEPLGRSTGGGGPGSPERSDGTLLELDGVSSTSTPRRRAGSIGMHLARATSAIGQGLASLSSSTSGGNLALAAAGGSEDGGAAAQVPRKASPPAGATTAADEPVPHDALAPVPAPAHAPALATSLLRTPPLVAVPLASPPASLSAPSTPHARHVAAPLLHPISVSAGHTPDPGVPPALAPSPRRPSDGKEGESSSGAPARPITTIATSPSMLARSQSESVRSHSGAFHTTSTTSTSTSTNGVGRASSLRFVPGSGGAGGPSVGAGGGKKSLKGGNLLSTFKLWFGQSADGPRKRKRASLVAPPSAALSSSASNGGSISFSSSSSSSGHGHGTSAAVARSQSMYVASPLRQSRPGMGSRRSSANSVSSPIGSLGAHGPGGTSMSLSRRSSVSSARGEPLTRTPSSRRAGGGGGGGGAGGYGSGRPRRASDASRTSASERGAWASSGAQAGEGAGAGASRPASVRSLSAGQVPRRGHRHGHGHAHGHSRAPSSSSVASLLLESGAAVGPVAVYRRPPTTTTVRRRHGGSHGRLSGESARSSSANVLATPGGGPHRDHHRRTRSSASSAHRASSESDVGGGGGTGGDSEYEDEDVDGAAGGLYVDFDEGEAPILEEDETAQDDSASGPAPPPASSTTTTSASSSLSLPPPARSASRPPPVARTRSTDRANSLGLGLALSHSPSASPSISPGSAGGPSLHAHHHHHQHASHPSSSSPGSSLSRFSTHTSGGGSSVGTTFTAHKATHLFGSPLQPRPAPSRSHAAGAHHARPVRDVFSKHAANGTSAGAGADDAAPGGGAVASSEWVDEDDDLAGYGGGLGQPAAGSASAAQAAAAAALGHGHEQPRAGAGAGIGDSPVATRMWEASAGAGAGGGGGAGGGASRFEGRYTGLSLGGGAGSGGASPPVGSAGGGAGVGQQQGRWARPAMVVEEEEEEEEE